MRINEVAYCGGWVGSGYKVAGGWVGLGTAPGRGGSFFA